MCEGGCFFFFFGGGWGGVSPRAPSPLTPAGGPGKDYEKAVEFYSRAIELNPGNAIYYGNRSLAYMRTECYGYALADATRAIELDKKYVKGYYRRATSNMALGKFKAALRDYETVRLEWGGAWGLCFVFFLPFFSAVRGSPPSVGAALGGCWWG